MLADDRCDPHYKVMMKNGYSEAPIWWCVVLHVLSGPSVLICLYVMRRRCVVGLFILSLLFTFVLYLFFGASRASLVSRITLHKEILDRSADD